MKEQIAAARALFDRLKLAFPALTCEEGDNGGEGVHIIFAAQQGLAYRLQLAQADDIISLQFSRLDLRYYPCDDTSVLEACEKVATDLISGEARVVEHFAGGFFTHAVLEVRCPGGWHPAGTTYALRRILTVLPLSKASIIRWNNPSRPS